MSSARLRVLQKMSVVLCRSISRMTLSRRPAAAMARPGDLVVLRKHDRELGLGAGIALDQVDQLGIAVGREPAVEGLGIGHGGGEADPAEPRRERLQPGERQRQEVAALAGGEGVDLVDHDGAEISNSRRLSSWLSSRLSNSGVVSSICGGRTRCRALRSEGVSPVRVSTRIGRPISSIGVSRLRWTSTASALSGEM